MIVVVTFGRDADIIECTNDIVENLSEYRFKFIDWLFDEQNNHSYWMYKKGEKIGCCYRSEAFVEWLNHFILANSIIKANVLESHVINWDKNLASISF